MATQTVLATIKLDLPGEPRGRIYHDGERLMVIQPDGEHEAVCDGECEQSRAVETIEAMYGERLTKPEHRVWGLEWSEPTRQCDSCYNRYPEAGMQDLDWGWACTKCAALGEPPVMDDPDQD